jgi:hypothetical protein
VPKGLDTGEVKSPSAEHRGTGYVFCSAASGELVAQPGRKP